nr:MAG TPA: hypothetical protein [Caudoviricetes sp.]
MERPRRIELQSQYNYYPWLILLLHQLPHICCLSKLSPLIWL